MPQQMIDLDVVAGLPKRVKIGGRWFLFPADLPVEMYLRINQAARAEDAGPEADQFVDLAGQLLELLQVHQPRLRRLPAGVGLVMLLQAIPTIYGPGQPQDEAPARPTRARAAGTRSGRRAAKSRRSRSSR
jgi:hypothetical protein